jgi:hypothetical protein
LSIFSRIRQTYLFYFSKPQANRPVYRAIRRHHAQNILEVGVGDGRRALRLIEIAKLASPGQEIRYIGLDRFEDRSKSDGPGLTFKAAYQLLRSDGLRVQLLPGEPAETLLRTANSLGKIDVLLLPATLESSDFSRMWFFVPRMLHENSLVFVERTLDDGQTRWSLKPQREIDELASAGVRRRAA